MINLHYVTQNFISNTGLAVAKKWASVPSVYLQRYSNKKIKCNDLIVDLLNISKTSVAKTSRLKKRGGMVGGGGGDQQV